MLPSQLVILCGGKGSRISKITKKTPKPLIKFNNKPFLYYLIKYYSEQGIKEFVLLSCYKNYLFKKFINDYKFKGIKIKLINEITSLGTGGGIIRYRKFLKNIFFLTNGDTFQEINLIDFNNFFIKSKKNIALSLINSNSRPKLGNLTIKKKIVNFSKKSKLINSGIYIIKRKILDKIKEKKIISLENEIIKSKIKNNLVAGYLCKNFFIDIGSYDSIRKLKNKKKLFKKKPALFLDRDGVINKNYGYVYKLNKLKFEPKIFKIINHYYKKKYLIIVISNQSGIGRKLFSLKSMKLFNEKIIKEFFKKKINILDFYICPHKPEDNCICRKPKPIMINKAIIDWNIDRSKSFMIGDKISDLNCAKRAKVKFYYKKNIDQYF